MALVNPSRPDPAGSGELAPEQQAQAAAAAAWVTLFSRTLKTFRLYDRDNPAVARFRDELARALDELLATHGATTLTFSADDILCHDVSLHPARSREDNLAMAFFRDGVRSLTFVPGMARDELATLLDLVNRASAWNAPDQDLVTMLWDSDLPHLEIAYIATEGDVEGAGDDGAAAAGTTARWPAAGSEAVAPERAPASDLGAASIREREIERVFGRSDDRLTHETTGQLEIVYQRLEESIGVAIERLKADHVRDHSAHLVTSALAMVEDCLQVGTESADIEDYGAFLPRVLREAIALGAWDEAISAQGLMRRCPQRHGSPEGFVEELCGIESIVTRNAVTRLDDQDAAGLQAFLRLAEGFGPAAAEWLLRVMAESRQQRVRRAMITAGAELLRSEPERLAPWLGDPRWYVVRNVVGILGRIGGAEVSGLLRVASMHGEFRVRREVIAALTQVPPAEARPILLAMVRSDDPRTVCAVLHRFATGPDPRLARLLTEDLTAAGFPTRTAEEQRAILSALAATGGDDVLPVLENELARGGWFGGNETHRAAIARCIARIGTPSARAVLEDGARSRNPGVRRACESVLRPEAA